LVEVELSSILFLLFAAHDRYCGFDIKHIEMATADFVIIVYPYGLNDAWIFGMVL
jgi:hypothetical protein